MDHKQEGNVVVAKADHGQPISKTLRTILKDTENRCAIVVSIIGMIKDFKLGFYDSNTGEYKWKDYEDPMELVSLKGSITEEGDIHLHAAVSGSEHDLQGGHLEGGEFFNVGEITMLVFEEIRLRRSFDEDRKMDLLSVE